MKPSSRLLPSSAIASEEFNKVIADKSKKNVLFFGESGSGKSSIISGFISHCRNGKSPVFVAPVRTVQEGQMTLTFNKYEVCENLNAFDTEGFAVGANYNQKEFPQMLVGGFKVGARLKDKNTSENDSSTQKKHYITTVVFVISAASENIDSLLKVMKDFYTMTVEKNIKAVFAVTHIDELDMIDQLITKDSSKMMNTEILSILFRCNPYKSILMKIRQLIDSEVKIFPIFNYTQFDTALGVLKGTSLANLFEQTMPEIATSVNTDELSWPLPTYYDSSNLLENFVYSYTIPTKQVNFKLIVIPAEMESEEIEGKSRLYLVNFETRSLFFCDVFENTFKGEVVNLKAMLDDSFSDKHEVKCTFYVPNSKYSSNEFQADETSSVVLQLQQRFDLKFEKMDYIPLLAAVYGESLQKQISQMENRMISITQKEVESVNQAAERLSKEVAEVRRAFEEEEKKIKIMQKAISQEVEQVKKNLTEDFTRECANTVSNSEDLFHQVSTKLQSVQTQSNQLDNTLNDWKSRLESLEGKFNEKSKKVLVYFAAISTSISDNCYAWEDLKHKHSPKITIINSKKSIEFQVAGSFMIEVHTRCENSTYVQLIHNEFEVERHDETCEGNIFNLLGFVTTKIGDTIQIRSNSQLFGRHEIIVRQLE